MEQLPVSLYEYFQIGVQLGIFSAIYSVARKLQAWEDFQRTTLNALKNIQNDFKAHEGMDAANHLEVTNSISRIEGSLNSRAHV